MIENWDAEIETPKALRGRVWGEGISLPNWLKGLAEHCKLPQQGPGRAPAENGFGAYWAQKNASDDNEFGIGVRQKHQNDQLQHVTLHYIRSGTKSG